MNAIGRLVFVVLFGMLAMQAHAQYYSGSGRTFVCKSDNFRQSYCAADTRGGVVLRRQISDSACIQGRTWGFDGRGVWVSQGCEGEFMLGGGYANGQVVHCASNDYHQRYCRADTSGGVQLVRQISDSACIRGRTWDFNGRGIWVSNGCEADFSTGGYVGGGYPPGPGPGYREGRTVRCESVGNRQVHCNVDTRGGVRLVSKLSNSSCFQGRDWGWDNEGIWVSGGCRADFRVGDFDR